MCAICSVPLEEFGLLFIYEFLDLDLEKYLFLILGKLLEEVV